VAPWIETVEVSALDTGLEIGDSFDFSHYKGYHFWTFDINAAMNLYTGVFNDGNTIAAKFGNANGVGLVDFTTFVGKIVIDGAGFWGDAVNLSLDGAKLEVVRTSSPGLRITNMYSTQGPVGICRVSVGAAVAMVQITNATMVGGPETESLLCLAATGHVLVSNSLFLSGPNQRAIAVMGAWAELNGNKFLSDTATVPVVDVTSGALRAVNNHFGFYGANVGSIRLAADSANHYLADNNTGVWPVTFGFSTDTLLGYYDLGDQPFSAAGIAASFQTPGNSVLTNSASGGYYFLRGNFVEGGADIIFGTNAYTTASGQFRLKVPGMPTPAGGASVPGCTVSLVSYVNVSSIPACNVDGAQGFGFSKVNASAAMTNVTTADVPASFGSYSLRLGWRYRIR